MWSNQNDALRIGLDATLTAAKLSKNKAADLGPLAETTPAAAARVD
jgi:hypothetical protein